MSIVCKGHKTMDDKLLDFAHLYMKEMGHGESGLSLLVYSLYDTKNTHLHFITSRVAPDRRKILYNYKYRCFPKLIAVFIHGNGRKKRIDTTYAIKFKQHIVINLIEENFNLED